MIDSLDAWCHCLYLWERKHPVLDLCLGKVDVWEQDRVSLASMMAGYVSADAVASEIVYLSADSLWQMMGLFI